ncbi:MAG: 30S ribosomal protein S2, partial [Candidatus Hydrothermarchaeales archaeon]
QVLTEASAIGIPVVALCDTDNGTSGVDLIIPANNKGKKALIIIHWLIARELLRERGSLGEDFPSLEDFTEEIIGSS